MLLNFSPSSPNSVRRIRLVSHAVGIAALCALIPAPAAFAQQSADPAPTAPVAPTSPTPAPAHDMGNMPGMSSGKGSMSGMSGMPGMTMDSMKMASSIDLLSPMSQEASGTAWLPSASPMYGKMIMRPNGDMLMLHGAVMPRYVDTGSTRGDRRVDAPNWVMGMYSHPLGANDQLGFRAMLSLDAITEGGYGYPLLYQTGETWHNLPLHDRQHPHDLFSELSVDYSHKFASQTSGYLYFGYPGEPALGPPTYMHRLIAYDLPDAPIGHHWQDATHITFGVLTAGVNLANRVKLESSVFTGREPDQDRYNFERPRFDSQSGRVSYNWDARNSFQVSYGHIRNPEGDGVDQHRVTSSWIYDRPLGDDANFTTTLSYGQNTLAGSGDKSNSVLAEADYNVGRNAIFGRAEFIQKSGTELALPAPADNEDLYAVRAYTLGYLHDVKHGKGIDMGVGGAVTLDTNPSTLTPYYGSGGSHLGFQVMLRFRPSRMDMSSMSGMSGMSGMGSMKGMSGSPAMADSDSPLKITAALATETPAAHEEIGLTVTVKDADGKPMPGATVAATVNMTTMDMGSRRVAFVDKGDGTYVGSVAFAMSGVWRVTVTVTPKGGKAVRRSFEFTAGAGK